MQTSLLIDAIVRQTTVLIAQLSTTSGLRAPLAHVANQVFLDLVTELEGQGVGRKVIADMFGLALRSYQQKVQRLQESATDRGATLWEAILAYIQEHKTVSRTQVLARFAHDDGATVRGVLNDLVGSSLVYRTGSGEGTIYRAAHAEELDQALEPAGRAAKQALVWVTVYRDGPLTRWRSWSDFGSPLRRSTPHSRTSSQKGGYEPHHRPGLRRTTPSAATRQPIERSTV